MSFRWILPLAFLVSACNGGDNKPNIEIVQNMFDQVSLKAQDWDPNKDGKSSQLTPPLNTVPRGKVYYKHMSDMQSAENHLQNPIHDDYSPELMELGKKKYEVYCGVCHGSAGDGKSLVGAKMLIAPRNFLEERVKKFSDGRIYWAIAKGYGTMGSYANQLHTEKERWAVVNYVRSLQKQAQ